MKKRTLILVGLALIMGLFGGAAGTTQADRLICPQTDWGRFDLELRLDGHPDSPWQCAAEGPIGEGRSQELRKDFSDSDFGYGHLLSLGEIHSPTINSPNGELSMQLVVNDLIFETCGDYDCRGEIHALWHFMVADEIVNFQASVVQEVTGRSSLCLYDHTADECLIQLCNTHFGEEKTLGRLQPCHDYTLSACLAASTWDGANRMTFTTDAAFVPEPMTLLLLIAGGLTIWLGPRQTSHPAVLRRASPPTATPPTDESFLALCPGNPDLVTTN